MGKLTASQVANKINKSVYTVKRWYKWYEGLTQEELANYLEQGMPTLPTYETIGATQWRYWNEEDIPQIREFSKWVPHTRGGVMGDLNKKED
jgi:hypothetical protein